MLIHCQKIRRALARRAPDMELDDLLREFVAFFQTDMLPHFQEEDDFVMPAAQAARDGPLGDVVRKLQDDHDWLRRQIGGLKGHFAREPKVRENVDRIEKRLTAHVKMEEEQLFEGVQLRLTEPQMQQLWKTSYAFRSTHRAPAACTVKPPASADAPKPDPSL